MLYAPETCMMMSLQYLQAVTGQLSMTRQALKLTQYSSPTIRRNVGHQEAQCADCSVPSWPAKPDLMAECQVDKV
jgi:hypothetical protein